MKEIVLDLWLRVENNSKFVRGKGKVRRGIEDYVLSEFNVKKPDKDGYEYELTVQYEDDEDLDEIVYGMLRDMDDEADCRHCFIETDIRSKDGSKSW